MADLKSSVKNDLLTPYQNQFYAWLLTRRSSSESMESFASTLVDAQIDLNPHQVDAALFACKNPLSKGVILADEVGLGKTIEAGLVISQHWAERRRRILIIVPANLRKQWYQELQDKFGQTKLFYVRTNLQKRKPIKSKPLIGIWLFLMKRIDCVTCINLAMSLREQSKML